MIQDGQHNLPRPTEKAKGIFACYINDETYVAKRQSAIVYNKTTGYLFLENSSSNFEFRLFVFEGLFDEATYSFANTGEEYILANGAVQYGIKSGGINELVITKLDLEEHIISADFIFLRETRALSTRNDTRRKKYDWIHKWCG